KAAVSVSRTLQERVTQDADEAVAMLSSDLKIRCDELLQLAGSLPSVDRVLPWAEFWHRYGYDARLIPLANSADIWFRRNDLDADSRATWADMNKAQAAFNALVM